MQPLDCLTIIDKILLYERMEGFLDRCDVMAFVQLESSFNERAYRFEPKLIDASYGLMQILSSTAKDRGFNGKPEELYDPGTNLTFGIRQIDWGRRFLLDHHYSLDPGTFRRGVVGAYNAGVGNILHGFIPGTYVDQWQKYRDTWARQLGDATA